LGEVGETGIDASSPKKMDVNFRLYFAARGENMQALRQKTQPAQAIPGRLCFGRNG
jgi:hypothetical protein